MGMKSADRGGKCRGSLAAIGAVAGEGDGYAGIGNQTFKGKALARTLQVKMLNLNFQQL